MHKTCFTFFDYVLFLNPKTILDVMSGTTAPFSGISYLILFCQTMHCLQSVMCLARHTGNEKTLQLRNLNACLAVLKCF